MKSANPNPSEDEIDNAVAEYLRRMDLGEDVDRDAYLATHEASAQELRSVFENENLFRKLLVNGPTQSLLDQQPQSDGQALAAAMIGSRMLPWTRLPAPFGRYRIEKLVGRGAMGSVYQAHDSQLERVVAIKLPHPFADGKPADRERLLQEARAAAALVHPNLCRIYDVGTIDGTDYIAMEFIEGRALSSYVHRGQLPSQKSVALIIRKLASALELAHQHGVIHRDVKPANILIRKNGEPVLMDFGLAQRPLLDGQARLTQAGTLVGSPAYMAPEQVRGEQEGIGPETDIYGLGVVLFELLTGRLPFDGSAMTILAKVLSTDPPPLSLLRPDAGPEISGICKRMLAKQTGDRFRSMKEVEQAIAAWQKSLTPKEAAASNSSPDKELPQYSDQQIASLTETARQCLRRRDYEMAAEILRPIPYSRHSDDSLKVFEEACTLAQEVQLLTEDMDRALARRQWEELPLILKRLLKLKPGHSRAKQLMARLESHHQGRTIRDSVGDVGDLLPSRSRDGLFHGLGRKIAAGSLAIFGIFVTAVWLAGNRPADLGQVGIIIPDLPPAEEKQPLRDFARPAENLPQAEKFESVAPNIAASVIAPTLTEGATVLPQSSLASAIEIPSPPEIRPVDELNSDAAEHSLWVSADGLRIYWESNGAIWSAERPSAMTSFENRHQLFPGRHATLDAAETTIIAVVDDVLCQSSRDDRNHAFPPLKPIPALSRLSRAKMPSCSAEGTTLVFSHVVRNQDVQIGVSRRASPAAPWGPPTPLVVERDSPTMRLAWPRLVDQGQSLLLNDESVAGNFRFALASRIGTSNRFQRERPLAAPGLQGFLGRSPQYIPATDEVWFLSPKGREIRRDEKDAVQVDWDIFRLTKASAALSSQSTERLVDAIPR